MATYVIGLLILVLLFLAGRHVVNNFRTGGHDCCGCTGCSSNGDSAGEAEGAAKVGCSCCALHK